MGGSEERVSVVLLLFPNLGLGFRVPISYKFSILYPQVLLQCAS